MLRGKGGSLSSSSEEDDSEFDHEKILDLPPKKSGGGKTGGGKGSGGKAPRAGSSGRSGVGTKTKAKAKGKVQHKCPGRGVRRQWK